MMHYGYGMGRLETFIIPLLLIGLIIYIIIKFSQDHKSSTKEEKENAIAILNERFAKGEISEEEYQRKKKLIKNQ
ncbi:SHOCT domain-containing protein [Garciella nitratireducens]|uniref:Putative membrane protein n=1 Tax=Garciella nitratireducens DSM 15102 TaxID=1121911 RepID=A0A1T4LH99_9FIRM|nr:SHOCT domain-containing protein [Garciella nitratireducens]SJZ54162.1 putative membrane protein [Garciella nitratireducens DSM 15102]